MVHFLEFGMLGIFLYNAFRHTSSVKMPFLWAIATGLIWGAIDEFHQYFVPGRMCSIWDFVADATGIVVLISVSKMLNDSYIKNKST
jgi:VanZ family protein